MIENTLLSVPMLELKVYCGQDKFYRRSKFGRYDKEKNRAPFAIFQQSYQTFVHFYIWIYRFHKRITGSIIVLLMINFFYTDKRLDA